MPDGGESTATTEERVIQLTERLRRLVMNRPQLANLGVTVPQLLLLNWIADCPGCRVQELADQLGVSAPTISVMVHRLQAAGMVQQQRDPQDRRAAQLYLTEKGQAVREQVRAFLRNRTQRLLSALTPDEQAVFLDLLERLLAKAEEGLAEQQPEAQG